MELSETIVFIRDEVDIAVARMTGRRVSEELPFDTVARYCIVTSVSELASNLFFHVGTGTIEIRIVNRNDGVKGLEVVAKDAGPGIDDIELAMQDGFSTYGSLGGGLPGVRRLMSEINIISTSTTGTEVRAVKWVDDHTRAFAQFRSLRTNNGVTNNAVKTVA